MNTRAKDIKVLATQELTKAVLSLYNAGVSTMMYMHGCPCPTLTGSLLVMSGSFLAACSSQACNQIIEVEQDKVMRRTKDRPLPSGRMTQSEAKLISTATGISSLAIFSQINPIASLTAATIWGGYIGIYVPLKKRTRFNTHIGAVVGALPVYLGWIAGTV